MNWALTYTFNYDDTYCQKFDEFRDASKAAHKWSIEEEGAPIYVWKLTKGNPIKWMEVSS